MAWSVTRSGVHTAVVLFVATSLCVLLLHLNASRSLDEEVRLGLVRLAAGASTTVDPARLAALRRPGDEAGADYAATYAALNRYLAGVPSIRFVYTARLDGDRVVFLVDGTPPGDADHDGVEDHAALLEPYDDAEPALFEALRTGVPTSSPAPYRDAWGTLMTGYAPVRDASGAVVAVVGVDLTAEQVVADRAGLVRRTVFTELVALLLSGVAGLVVSRLDGRRARAEDHLQAERERQRRLVSQILDTLDHALFVVDRDGVLQGCNHAYALARGRPRESLVHRPRAEALTPEEAAVEARHDAVAFAAGTPTSHETTTDGRTLLTRRLPTQDAEGRALLVGVVFDVTEERLRAATLERARHEAEAAVATRSRFLANMSHELRTPMNGVLGMTELLLGTALDEEQRSCAETVRSSAGALLVLLDEILDLSKLEAGKVELESVPVSWVELVEDVATLLAPRAQGKGLELVVDVDPAVPAATRGDPTRVRQVLTNLVGNAVKFTSAGHVRLAVAREGGALRFEVEDTGIGISEAARVRLFDPFHQADSSTTRRFGGTGLGLSISKGLVERMGGTVAYRPAPSGGSVFTFTLPCDPVDAAPAALPRSTRPVVLALPAGPSRDALARLLRASDTAVSTCDDPASLPPTPAPPVVLLDAAWGRAGLPSRLERDGATIVVLARHAEVAAARTTPGVAEVLPCPARREALTQALARAETRTSRDPATRRVEAPASRFAGRVLLAEDNVVNQKVALLFLRRVGLEADLAENGAEAVARVREHPYDLVLMDCQMPEVDGYEATRQIRALGLSVPICALTANTMEGDREACLAAGMDDFLSKPLQPPQLAALLGRWLRRAA